MDDYDFCGYATKANMKCSDGLTIMPNAFIDDDGKKVPLCWNHQHNSVEEVLGHAILENREDGVFAYCKFNDTENGQTAKLLVKHGDIDAMSIYANKLKKNMNCVMHGVIREVSLVMAGANPGAFIESVVCHSDEDGEAAQIYTDEYITIANDKLETSHDETIEHSNDKKEDIKMAEEAKKTAEEKTDGNEKTVKDVIDSMTEEQKTVMYALIGQALEDIDDEDEEDENMKHNVFDQDDEVTTGSVLSHSDEEAILSMAKATNVGTFQNALQLFAEENDLQHDALSSGFVQSGSGNVTELFPDYKDVRPTWENLITNDQGWINVVMQKVHKSPISRIRTGQVDIRNIDALRAKGYKKGKDKKLTGNFQLVRRTTDPQTVYVKSQLHRDDIIDITDFDYVNYLYNIDRMMLNEELAMAIMLGDGREVDDPDKISPDHIRPIWLDDDLYTLHVEINQSALAAELQGSDTNTYFGKNFIEAESLVNTMLYARENFKGSGTPDLYITPHKLNVMLLARDRNGHRLYSSKAELASALNVGNIYTAEQFENKTRVTTDSKTKKLHAIIVNLADYSLGATKGGEVTHFTQFDIDFNSQKSLLETRVSGALTRVYSAIAIEEDVTAGA